MTGKRARRDGEEDGEGSKKKIAIPNSAKHSLQGLIINLEWVVKNHKCINKFLNQPLLNFSSTPA